MDRRLTESIWCTGKDSNLRTSLGGTDLQSVGFNHSPTCAKNPGRCGRCAPSSTVQERRNRSTEKPADQSILLSQYRETKARAKKPRRSLHAGKFPNGVCLEKPAAPLPSPPNRRKIVSSFVVTLSCSVVLWSWRRDLNPRPPDYKSGALPTELRQHSGTAYPPGTSIPSIPSKCPGQFTK